MKPTLPAAWLLALAAVTAASAQDVMTPVLTAPAPPRPAAPPPSGAEGYTETPDTLIGEIKMTSFPLNGWTFLAGDENAAVLYRFPIQRQAGVPRITVRWEYINSRMRAGERYLSVQEVAEVDCIRGQSHTVQRTQFKAHNLVWPLPDEPLADAGWTEPEPGSLAEVVFHRACAPP